MSKILLSIFLLCCTSSFRTHADIASVRSMFQQAASDEVACKKMILILSPHNENNPLMLGYKGSGTMMMARHVFNPFSKLSYFKKGKQMLESAIDLDEQNFELRFLRFAAQTNMPAFLGYNNNIEHDKKFILNYFSKITDVGLKEFVLPALKTSKYLTHSEKEQLK